MAELYQHRARKRFGQNFLHDGGVIDRIQRAIHPKAGERLLEIGPGQGALTGGLVDSGAQLDVIELDKDLIPLLKLRFGLKPNFRLHEGDALKFDFSTLEVAPRSLRVVGNLPYNISTPLIFHLLEQAVLIRDMHFMLQKEVVDRITAEPNTKEYGRLSVMMQYYCKPTFLFEVPPGAFNPPPKVTSAVFRLEPYVTKPIIAKDEKALARLVAHVFTQRRKTLRNSLKGMLAEDAFERAGVDPMARPETLSLSAFVALADQMVN